MIFYFFIGFTIFSAIGVAGSKNLFHAAVYLLFSVFGLSGLFIFLEADFIALAVILIYAGIIALILLFILFLNAGHSCETSKPVRINFLFSFFITLALLILMTYIGTKTHWMEPSESLFNASPGVLAEKLITEYLLPLEIISFILLSTLIGAALFTRKAR